MKKMRFKTNFNSTPHPGYSYVEGNCSQTVPSMSMSINEIISRSQKGLPVPQASNPVFNGDVDLPDPSQMDLRDLELLRDQLSAQVADIETQKAKIEDERRKKEDSERARFKEEQDFIREQLAKRNTIPPPSPT